MTDHFDDCAKDMCEMSKTISCQLKPYIMAGIPSDKVKEAGELADIAKDFAEAACKLEEMKYYCNINKAMDEESQAPDLYGYNHYHTGSGRFATKGNGHYMGYEPMLDEYPGYNHVMAQKPYIDGYLRDPNFSEIMRMGYHDAAINQYRDAKKHYTQTNSTADKDKMNSKIDEHLNNAIPILKEMWHDADPTLRKRMKTELTALANEIQA